MSALKISKRGLTSSETETEVQQERIDLAARELAEVGARLQAASDALRASV
jgi:hypothetical protein